MIELTELQQQAIDQHSGRPIELVDPRTQTKYVLLQTKVFERLQSILEEDDLQIDSKELGALVDRIMKEDDENDPWLDSYQKYKDAK